MRVVAAVHWVGSQSPAERLGHFALANPDRRALYKLVCPIFGNMGLIWRAFPKPFVRDLSVLLSGVKRLLFHAGLTVSL